MPSGGVVESSLSKVDVKHCVEKMPGEDCRDEHAVIVVPKHSRTQWVSPSVVDKLGKTPAVHLAVVSCAAQNILMYKKSRHIPASAAGLPGGVGLLHHPLPAVGVDMLLLEVTLGEHEDIKVYRAVIVAPVGVPKPDDMAVVGCPAQEPVNEIVDSGDPHLSCGDFFHFCR